MGRGRGAGAGGRASDGGALSSSIPLALAISLEFLRLCLSAGIVKVGVKLLLQFSNFCFDRVFLLKPKKVRPDELSVRGELWRASHRKEEEEEERSCGRLVSRETVLSWLHGLIGD